jgi:hypothetical protein
MPADGLKRWDCAGMVLSTACAVHCAVLPLVAGLLPLIGLERLGDARLEWSLLTAAIVIGVVGHTRSYRHNHRHAGPALVFACGMFVVLGARLVLGESHIGLWALGLGGALAAASHWANVRLCACCPPDDNPLTGPPIRGAEQDSRPTK